MPAENTIPLYLRKIPGALKRDFKILCYLNGASMQEKIIELIQKSVDENKELLDRIKKDIKKAAKNDR